jgi:hypothetical protein
LVQRGAAGYSECAAASLRVRDLSAALLAFSLAFLPLARAFSRRISLAAVRFSKGSATGPGGRREA